MSTKWMKHQMRACASILLGAAALVAGCTNPTDARSTNTAESPAATPSSVAPIIAFDQIPGEFLPERPEVPGAAVAAAGACVALGGEPAAPILDIVQCGSRNNGYRVVERVHTPEECKSDVEQKFYMNGEDGQFTACLDYAWMAGDCLSIGSFTAIRASCDDMSVPRRERPVSVLLDVTSADACPDGGFAHPVRRFTVCTKTMGS